MTGECSENQEECGSSNDVILPFIGNPFFKDLEIELGTKIPLYLKNLLIFSGFDSTTTFKNLTEEYILRMEKFAQTQMKKLIPAKCKMSDFYGIYSTNPEDFRILPGHRTLIIEMQNLVNTRRPLTFNRSTLIENRTTLIKNIKFWCEEQNYCDDSFQKLFARPKDYVDVAIKVVGNVLSYVAEVKCVVCNSIIIIHKKNENFKPKWNISKFTMHVSQEHKNLEALSKVVNHNSPQGSEVVTSESNERSILKNATSIKRKISTETSSDENILDNTIRDPAHYERKNHPKIVRFDERKSILKVN